MSTTPNANTSALRTTISALLDDTTFGLAAQRQHLIDMIASSLSADAMPDIKARREVLEYALERLQPRAVSFEEAVDECVCVCCTLLGVVGRRRHRY